MYAVQTCRPEDGGRRTEDVRLEPARPALLARLRTAAAEDRHRVIAATHVVLRGEEVVGYASLGGHRLFFAWLHTTKLNKHESFRAWRLAEALAAGQGLVLAVSPDSPLLPFVERMGYEKIGTAVLFLKK